MKVVILAAGSGKRFKNLNQPKALTQLVNGKSILQLQLDHLSSFVSSQDIIIVVGYNKQKIIDQFPDFTYVNNPLFATENTSKSLLKALENVHEDVLWLNGDVVFHPNVLEPLLNCKTNCMLVNKCSVGDEEVKYRTDPKGKILEVSKQVKNPEGEALGINFFTVKDLQQLKNNLAACQDNDYFERAIEMCIQQGIEVKAVPIPVSQCSEIDFPEDLDKANEMIKKWVDSRQ